MSIHAVILAAGSGRRMGNRPKALLELEGETYLSRTVHSCRRAGCEPVWMVIRPGLPELAGLAASLDGFVVLNPDPERGMFSSVQCGLAAARSADPGAEGFLIHPVDHPRVRPGTIALVIGQLRAAGVNAWVVPRLGGRGGHPVGVGRQAAEFLLGAAPASSLREELQRARARRVDLDLDDPGILANVNLPEDAAGDTGN